MLSCHSHTNLHELDPISSVIRPHSAQCRLCVYALTRTLRSKVCVAVGPLPKIRRRKLRISQPFADPPRLIGDLILAELLRDRHYRTAASSTPVPRARPVICATNDAIDGTKGAPAATAATPAAGT